MAFGPLARVAVQVMMTVGGAVGRAAMEAYKEAAAGRGAAGAAAQRIAGRRMSLDEARQVLDADVLDGQSKIQERFELLHKLNGPTEEFAGSPYLQVKIAAARPARARRDLHPRAHVLPSVDKGLCSLTRLSKPARSSRQRATRARRRARRNQSEVSPLWLHPPPCLPSDRAR
mmetsp:Transcript_25964/g.83793  ORF Transcript_25964/g.83793 Transcript_25964/m.83793 type:complete len:173 (+) Transcript_25964:108-626(+)